jgi:hypothetical protein
LDPSCGLNAERQHLLHARLAREIGRRHRLIAAPGRQKIGRWRRAAPPADRREEFGLEGAAGARHAQRLNLRVETFLLNPKVVFERHPDGVVHADRRAIRYR